MAGVEYTQDVMNDDVHPASRFGKLANLVGGAVSLALLVGIGVWGYKLIMRDVTGIPVVRAVDGPMRVQPENPGGRLADHQGLAVNQVAAIGAAEPPADTLILAPQPVSLAKDDMIAVPQAVVAVPTPDDSLAEAAEQPEQAAPVAAEDPAQLSTDIDALVAQITAGVEPLAEFDTDDTGAEPDDAPRVAAISADVPGLARSLRPAVRPASLVSVAHTSAREPEAAVEELSDVPVGTRVVQLGAFPSADVARAEWDRLAARFDGHLPGKQRVVQQATSGGRTFYRLRAAGFEDLSDARRFCAVLVAEGADCIPVVAR
jgi:hypothetical protein